MSYVIGTDIGGTFTDCIVVDDAGRQTIGKALSTGPEFHEGCLAAIEAAADRLGLSLGELVGEASGVYHGSTVATNALVEGRTAKVGLLTTRGHRDVLATMRAGRRLMASGPVEIAHVARQQKPAPLVPKPLIAEVNERVAVDGSVVVDLDEDGARAAIEGLLADGVGSFAISLLWSIANDAHERRLAELVAELAPDAFVSVASRVVRRTGEYERTVAAVVNAMVGPIMGDYLARLEHPLREHGYGRPLRIMTATGGVISAAEASELALLTIGSGPVGGLIGAGRLGEAMERGDAVVGDGTVAGGGGANVLTADMGGTTLDVGVIRDGRPLTRPTSWHGQFEYYSPTLDVRSIGAGGGSLIRFDRDIGTLLVGPESAGSRPGPACYGRGGEEATVTDANLVLGRINPDNFLGGGMSLDVEAARTALARAGEPLGLDAEATAVAAVRIVESQMADAIRLASVEQGYDPRQFTLFAYGGAGPLHGAALARELGVSRVVVPLSDLAAGWSAFGVASSDVMLIEEVALGLTSPFDPAELDAGWAHLEGLIRDRMAAYDVDGGSVTLARSADIKYRQQVNELEIAAPDGEYDADRIDELVERFEREYAQVFGAGTGYAKAGFAVTGLRLRATAPADAFRLASRDGATAAAATHEREVLTAQDGAEPVRVSVVVHDGPGLEPGVTVEGPAIVEFPDTSVVVQDGMRAHVDAYGSVVVEVPA